MIETARIVNLIKLAASHKLNEDCPEMITVEEVQEKKDFTLQETLQMILDIFECDLEDCIE